MLGKIAQFLLHLLVLQMRRPSTALGVHAFYIDSVLRLGFQLQRESWTKSKRRSFGSAEELFPQDDCLSWGKLGGEIWARVTRTRTLRSAFVFDGLLWCVMYGLKPVPFKTARARFPLRLGQDAAAYSFVENFAGVG
jgi:hypothetical protein